MLASLYIRNYALIGEAKLELDEGMTVLTGETGAGKSLLLGALGLILGKRADSSMIFDPERKCLVEARFTTLSKSVKDTLENFEEFDLEDEELVIRREVSAAGKSRAFVNDTPVSLQLLRQVTGMLVDLHGQHENMLLQSPEKQLALLDQYAGCKYEVLKFSVGMEQRRRLQAELESLREEERNARQQQDYYRFQVEELDRAELDEEEATNIESDLALLQHAEEIKESLSLSAEGLYNDEDSLYVRLSTLLRELDRPARLSEGIAAQKARLEEARETLQDAAYELERINDSTDLDPGELARMEARQDLYNRLLMKFGVQNVAELIAVREDFRAGISGFDHLQENIRKLEKRVSESDTELAGLSIAIENSRKKAIPLLETAVNELLDKVGLERAEFQAVLERLPESEKGLGLPDATKVRANSAGINSLSFHIRTNPGMPMGPLAQIASGGELSRVMLALKSALAEKAELSTLIFDEIDTGISGETANKVATVMRALSARYQVIAITHLPQIAGRGHQHSLIRKVQEDGSTRTEVLALGKEDRVMELARMLSGADPSPSAVKNAEELINSLP